MSKPKLTELATGERVISERVPGVRSVALGFWIGAGSRDEPVARAGVSHFIEHLLFKGSSRYSAQEIAEIFDELGGELNAATSRETTVLYARIPDDRLERALDVMTDMVFRPTFTDVDSEREVVLEEIAMVEDTPNDLVHDIASEAVFGSHPLGRPVIGRADVISSVSRRALSGVPPPRVPGGEDRAGGGRQRSPRRARLPASPNGSTEGTRGRGSRIASRRAPNGTPGLRFQRKDTEQYHVCLSAPGISRIDDRRFAASLMDAIVGGSASSRLFQEIREKRGMAYSVYSYSSQYDDTGQIGVYVGTREDNLAECLEITVAELTDIASGNVRADELARAKENLKGRILLSLESTSARMTRLGKSTITDTPLLTPEEIVKRLEAVTAPEVAELADALLAPERLSVAGIGPDEGRFTEAVGRVNPAAARAGGLMRIALYGASGKVGALLVPALADAGHEVVDARSTGPEGCDAAIDFTRPDAVVANVGACLAAGVPVVIGTTGFELDAVDTAARDAGVPCFYAPNFTQGAVLMMRFAEEAAKRFPRAEIVELHSEAKRDAPSGTARATAERMGTDPVIHSVRLPGLVAHQEVIFGGPGETLTIRHDTISREAFVPGVLLALERVRELPAGLTVGLDALDRVL